MRATVPFLKEDDHHPAITVRIDTSTLKFLKEIKLPKTNFFKADYDDLNLRLSKVDWVSELNDLDAEGACARCYEIIQSFIDTLPKCKGRNRNYPPWYTNELIGMIKCKEKARSRKRSGRKCDVDNYRSLRRAVKAEIVKCHDDYIRNTEEKLLSNTKCFFSYTKSLRKSNSFLNSMKYVGDQADRRETVCDLFARFFDSVYRQGDTPVTGTFESEPCDSDLNLLSVSEVDVKSALCSFDCNKVNSPDSVAMIFYKKLSDNISLPLAMIFNKSLSSGIFPSAWKLSFITPIY